MARHRDLAEAIAPIIVAAIRNEIKNSREAMVEALYPITGQMVVAAVANAFRELMAAMNERLEKATSFDRWKLLVRARLTGRPMSELALSKQGGARLLRVLFLERGSGQLLASWRADGLTEDRGELIGGLLAALNGFAREALGETGELRTLDFAGHNIYVHASPAHLIASEVSLPLRVDQKANLDRECLEWLTQYAHTGVTDDLTFAMFIEGARARSVTTRRKGMGLPLKILFAMIAVVALGYVGRSSLYAWRAHAIQSAFQSLLDERPALAAYPIEVATDHATGRVTIHGLAPSGQDVDALRSRVAGAAGAYAVTANVGIVTSDAAMSEQNARASSTLAAFDTSLRAASTRIAAADAKIEALTARLDGLEGRAASAADVAVLSKEIEALPALKTGQTQISTSARSTENSIAALDARVTQLQSRLDAPRARLAALIAEFSVFFDRDQPIDQPGLADRLDVIAALLREAQLGLRVVGYSDDSGAAAANLTISRKRAEVVADALAARGVSRDLLSIVGRAAADPIADPAASTRTRNRRVSFELPFDREISR